MTVWIDPNYVGSLYSNPNKIQTNHMDGGVVQFFPVEGGCIKHKMHMNHTIRVEPPAFHGDKASPQNTRQTSSSTISAAIVFIIHILSELESSDDVTSIYISL